MVVLDKQNLWYGFYPISLVKAIDCNIVFVRRYLLKLIKITCLLMNWLWRYQCKMIHTKALEEVEIEEYQDLLDELDEALTLESSWRLIKEGAINTPLGRNKLLV